MLGRYYAMSGLESVSLGNYGQTSVRSSGDGALNITQPGVEGAHPPPPCPSACACQPCASHAFLTQAKAHLGPTSDPPAACLAPRAPLPAPACRNKSMCL